MKGKKVAIAKNLKNGHIHEITEGKDKVVYCDCWAWKRNRRCRHLDTYFNGTIDPADPTIQHEGNISVWNVNPNTGTVIDDPLEDAVSQAINDIKRR